MLGKQEIGVWEGTTEENNENKQKAQVDENDENFCIVCMQKKKVWQKVGSNPGWLRQKVKDTLFIT